MQILRLLAARRFRRRRRAVSTITATAATAPVTPRGCGVYGLYGEEEDEGPFFDLDLSCCSAPASSAGSQAAESSGSESEDTTSSCPATATAAARGGDLDFVISLQRSRSGSPSYEERLFFRGAAPPRRPAAPGPPPLMFCASEPSDAASRARHSSASASRRGGGCRLQLRTLSFGSAKAAFYGGRASFSRSTSSFYGGYGSPDQDLLRDEGRATRPPPSGDVIRRYLSKISSRLRRVAVAPGAAAADLRLRKSRSASATQVSAAAAAQSPTPARRDDSLAEKQDGIASAIAHCKESLHRGTCADAVMLTPPTPAGRASRASPLKFVCSPQADARVAFPLLQRPSRRWTRRWCDRGVTQGRKQRASVDDAGWFRHLPRPPFRSGTPEEEASATEASR
jgi:hypothetical protein